MVIAGYRIPMVLSLVLWAGVWEVVGRSGLIFIFPPFSEVIGALVTMMTTRQFIAAALLSLKSFTAGMLIAVGLGIPVGFWMGRSQTVNRLLGMWVNVFASAPLSSLVPVIMLLFGLGQTTIIVTVAFFALWVVILDTQAGVRHVSPSLEEMARSFSASRWQLYGKILVLAALPEILAGIRMGVIRAVKGVVIGQLLVSVVGFGEMFAIFTRNFFMERFWALTLVLFAFALGLSWLVEQVENRIEYYAGSR